MATLNTPARPTDTSASTPPGPISRNVLPSAPDLTSTARQSASSRPAAENVVTGTGADLGEPPPVRVVDVHYAETGGMNSDALARK